MKIPDQQKFTKSVEHNEDNYGIVDCIYVQCIKEFSQIQNLTQIDNKIKKRVLGAFLFDWGKMQRQLGYAGLDAVYKKIKEKTFSKKIDPFRQRNLKKTDLTTLESETIQLFDDLSKTSFVNANKKIKTLGSTTASKVLHLCCPDFFIMWDSDIRYGNGEGKDYFEFLTDMKNLWKALDTTIVNLEKTYNKKATRIIDEFNWYESHPSSR
jgi:hypothetical protein